MDKSISRRGFLRVTGLAGTGGSIAVSGVSGFVEKVSAAEASRSAAGEDFFFVQLSDTHWGFNNAAVNPDFSGTLKKAVAAVNAMSPQPDFVVFTGDLTHTTDDDAERRARLTGFRDIVKDLKNKDVKFLAGEHDASLDAGKAFREFFGDTHYSFDHKGVHFIALDNVSDASGILGDVQLQWLAEDLKKHTPDTRIVVLTHRPLFDLAADWDWTTRDGAKAVELLMPYKNVAVLYGHIHQINHHATDHINHHSAMGLMYPLPAPHSVPKKAPIPWDPATPYKGLGYRDAMVTAMQADLGLKELPVVAEKDPPENAKAVKISAKKFEYSPSEITLKKGVPITLEFTSADQKHGFNCPGLNIRTDIEPGKTNSLKVTPDKAGVFDFHCDVFCGSGHEQMAGTITVTE